MGCSSACHAPIMAPRNAPRNRRGELMAKGTMRRYMEVMFKRVSIAASAALLLAAAPGHAQSLVSTGESFAAIELIPGHAGSDGVHVAGITISMSPGWKTYWRSPGDAGVPPMFDWSASENVADLQVLWPAPEAFESFGMRTIGYAGEVVLPVRVTPLDPAQPVSLRLSAMVGVCDDICVLEETTAETVFSPGADGAGALSVQMAEDLVPRLGSELGIAAACAIRGAGLDRNFSAELSLPSLPADAVVIIEGPEEAWFGEAETRRGGAGLIVEAPVAFYDENAWVDRSTIRITVLADGFSADIRGCAPLGG